MAGRGAPFLLLGIAFGAAAASVVALLHPAVRDACIAIATLFLFAFFIGYRIVEGDLRRGRPFEDHGRMARWRHPARHPLALLANGVANSRVLSAWLEPLPMAPMVSDIEDVLYINYLVPAAVAAKYVPYGLELERLGSAGEWALFSFLTYRHGHFGFRFLGPLRRLFPSPVQTNWRIHVRDPRTGIRGIYFLTNGIDFTPPALGARLFTEGMPMHVFEHSEITRDAAGGIRFSFTAGQGTAPVASGDLIPAEAPKLAGPWADAFGDWSQFLAYCVPQNRAMSGQRWHRRITRHEITLPIPLDRVEPLVPRGPGAIVSATAAAIAGDAEPICFRVPNLFFTFEAELHDPVPDAEDPRAGA
jgi:hypothetical protein